MPIIIPSITEIATKWKTITPTRVADYEHGVRNPRADWLQRTSSAAQAWITAMQMQSTYVSWAHGVNDCGTLGWQNATILKGIPRWGAGVAASGNKYQEGFGPYRDCIANLDLPPRGPAGAPQNLERVRIIAEALHNLKIGA